MTAEAKAFPFPTTAKTLPNGLRVFVVEYDSPGLVAYYSIVRAGSRNEVEPGKSGFAHFFEHMMFRGTPQYPTEKYNAAIKAMGADSNAFTSDDMTVFHILAGVSALPTIVTIEANRFQHLQYSEAEFQKESRAVLGEYNKGASNPLQPMFESLYDHAFKVHTYKHTTIGFLRDIEDMPNQFAYSRQFFDRYYRPDNVILLVVGDVTPDKVMPLIEQHYGAWGPGPARPAIPVEPPQAHEQRVTVPWKGASLPMLLIGYPHARLFDREHRQRGPRSPRRVGLRRTLAALSPLGSRGTEGREHRRLGRSPRRSQPLHHPGPSQAKQGPSLRGKRHLRRDCAPRRPGHHRQDPGRGGVAYALRLCRPALHRDRVALVGAEFLALTGKLTSIDDTFALLSQVTVADVKRVAAKYFTPQNRTVVVLEPEAQ